MSTFPSFASNRRRRRKSLKPFGRRSKLNEGSRSKRHRRHQPGGTMKYNRILLGIATVLALVFVPSDFGQASADEAKQLFQQAQEMAKAQKFDQAITTLKKALQLAPNNDLYLAHASNYE